MRWQGLSVGLALWVFAMTSLWFIVAFAPAAPPAIERARDVKGNLWKRPDCDSWLRPLLGRLVTHGRCSELPAWQWKRMINLCYFELEE